jgi:hypothetical protein
MKGAGWYAVARECAAKSISAAFIENGTDPFSVTYMACSVDLKVIEHVARPGKTGVMV